MALQSAIRRAPQRHSCPDLRTDAWFQSDEYAELTRHSYLARQRHFGQLEHARAASHKKRRASLRKAAVSVLEAIQLGAGGYTSGCWVRTLKAAQEKKAREAAAAASPARLGSRGSSNSTLSGSDSSSSSLGRVAPSLL